MKKIFIYLIFIFLFTIFQVQEPLIKEERKVIHMVGNNHIDPIWLWGLEEGLEITRSIFSSVLDKMKIYPEFTFSASSALLYEWIEKIDENLFKEIKRRVKEGRWSIVGGFYVEPDCNLPSGESFVRQGLYGQRYFKEKFGIIPRIGYNPDSFGHNFALPQILKKLGLEYYVFFRPDETEKKLYQNLFIWKGLDGSEILTYRISKGCNLRGEILENTIKEKENETNLDTHMILYEAGDYINNNITDENIKIIKNYAQNSNSIIKFSTPEKFFEDIKRQEKYLKIRDELQYHARGCYSNIWWVKKENRKLENLLLTAEKISVLGEYLGISSYPNIFTSLWKKLLFTQFHDIIGGVCIKEIYPYIRNIYGNIENNLNDIIVFTLKRLFKNIDTSKEGLYIIIFNPTTFEREVPIEIEIPNNLENYSLIDKDEKPILFQLEKSSSITFLNRKKLIFLAKLPPFGYTSYRLVKRNNKFSFRDILKIKNYSLENKWLYLEIDPDTGYIKRFFDKENNREIFKNDGCIPLVIKDDSDAWAHGVDKFKDIIGKFKLEEIKIIEKGPVRGIIRVKSRYGNSVVIQDFCLYKDLNYVEVNVKLDWHEKHKMLKLSFPLNLSNPKSIYQIPYGFIERACNGEENPGLSFLNVEDNNYGLSLINSAKYGYDVDNNILSLTVVRSPVYAHHNPKKLNSTDEYEYIDQGEQEFKYILYPYKGSWKENYIIQASESLNNPPLVFIEGNHNGNFPIYKSFLEYSGENFLINVIKKHEDGLGIIVRIYETLGKKSVGRIKLFNKEWDFFLNPFEIKTFLINREFVKETNLLEEILK